MHYHTQQQTATYCKEPAQHTAKYCTVAVLHNVSQNVQTCIAQDRTTLHHTVTCQIVYSHDPCNWSDQPAVRLNPENPRKNEKILTNCGTLSGSLYYVSTIHPIREFVLCIHYPFFPSCLWTYPDGVRLWRGAPKPHPTHLHGTWHTHSTEHTWISSSCCTSSSLPSCRSSSAASAVMISWVCESEEQSPTKQMV